jgi:hypothetical protein
MTSSKLLRASLAACILALAPAAFGGQPTAEDYATARALYKEGKELRAKGDLKGALEKLKAAHVLGHTPITGLELARTEQMMGLLVEARETCLDVVRMPVASDESKRSAAARDEAAKLAAALRPRLAAIRIHVAGSGPFVVTVDGQKVPEVSQGEPRLVNPGHHVVTAQVEGGAAVSGAVDVVEAQTGDVSLSPPAAPHVEYRATPPPPPPPVRPPHRGLGGVTIGGIVVTSGGLVVGAIGGLVALAGSVSLNKNCVNSQCGPDYWDTLDSARAAALASTIGFSVAGAGVVLLVVGLLTHHSSTESAHAARVEPQVGLGTIGVRGAF